VEIGESGARLLRASAGVPPRRPHAIGRAARVRGALGSRGLTRPAAKFGLREKSVRAGRGPLSRLAGTRAWTLSVLVYAASEESPAGPHAEFGFS